MIKAAAASILLFFACFAQGKEPINELFDKTYKYTDASGTHSLKLKEFGSTNGENIAKKLEAQLIDGSEPTSAAAIQIKDFITDQDSTVKFIPEAIELTDLDGDGLIDPIIFYKFFVREDLIDLAEITDHTARSKLIVFWKGKKAVIRAVTGNYDDQRRTVANDVYFTLPGKAQDYLVKKMEDMYHKDIFLYDNRNRFKPRKK